MLDPEVCFALNNGHCQAVLLRPKSANRGSDLFVHFLVDTGEKDGGKLQV